THEHVYLHDNRLVLAGCSKRTRFHGRMAYRFGYPCLLSMGIEMGHGSRRFAAALGLAILFLTPPLSPHAAFAHRTNSVAKAQSPGRGIRLAITVDDLPGGGPESGDFTHPRMVSDIIAALRAHGVQHATGFVVGSMLEGHPERQASIDAWVNAGFEVGNH